MSELKNNKRPLKIAIQMDPIESIIFARDSSHLLGLEAQNRGHEIFYYQPYQLSLDNGKVVAELTKITLYNNPDNYYSLGEKKLYNLEEMDVILMRQDPPFDMNYITYTYLLEMLKDKVLVVNDPTEVRNCSEKIFVCLFAKFMPKTLITGDINRAQKFLKEHNNNIILKTLYSFSGNDVFHIQDASELTKQYEFLYKKYNAPLMLQEFLPGIKNGDKRIVLIDGEIVGTLNRMPKEGNFLSNMIQGGKAVKTEITDREHEICAALKPELKKRNLILAGIDVIDGHLTEINVTCPTGLKVINGLYGIKLEQKFWDVVEKKIKLCNFPIKH